MEQRDNRTIKIEDLQVGGWYIGRGRNCQFARWNGKEFYYFKQIGYKYYLDTELHWDTDDKFGTFQPYALLWTEQQLYENFDHIVNFYL